MNKKKITYAWGDGANKSVSPEVVGAELEKIRRANDGVLRPEDLVEAAKAEEHPCHRLFCWDKDEALRRYLLYQARNIINHLHIVVENRPPLNVYVNVKVEQTMEQVYVLDCEARSDRFLRVQVVRRAKNELRSWLERHQEYSELGPYAAAIVAAFETDTP